MRKTTAETAASPTAQFRLAEIQQQMREICQPPHRPGEFYQVTSERGFVKITLPQPQRRR